MERTLERIVMTPRRREPGCTTLLVERRPEDEPSAKGDVHVAGGAHQGLVVNKQATNEELPPPDLVLKFCVFLVNSQTGEHGSENRTLRFWCSCAEQEQASLAQEFFKQLVSPLDFPRDYVGFIKKVMKLLQTGFHGLDKVEVEMRQLEVTEKPPERPQSADEAASGRVLELTEERLMEMIEANYPNPINLTDLASERSWDEAALAAMVADLQQRGLVVGVPDQAGAFTRAPHGRDEIQVVCTVPRIAAGQPTIAVITSQYCEKLAVDAMLTDTETYVRYNTVGESNVYTLGTLGSHRVVTTKLPTSGHTREAMTAAGTFQQVELVFLVGVGGGVPHYTDDTRHVRLGDVVLSHPGEPPRDTPEDAPDQFQFETRSWCPPSNVLQQLAESLSKEESDELSWQTYLREAQEMLAVHSGASEGAADFSRPPASSDKLFMSIGSRDVIEVAHPTPASTRMEGYSRLHLGPIASGRLVSRDETCRQKFATLTGALAFDPQLDAAVQSVQGNCRDAFIAIRGISDYRDGSRRSEWQPYAALAAASVMKAIILSMELTH